MAFTTFFIIALYIVQRNISTLEIKQIGQYRLGVPRVLAYVWFYLVLGLSDFNGSKVRFPYRLYFEDDECVYSSLSDIEKAIYSCMFTRHCDGHIREKHLGRLLSAEMQEWFMPYILRLSSEYVVEIVENIYETIKGKDNQAIQEFCHNNPLLLKRAYIRMTSYWECYYKMRYPKFKSYIGRKLFKDCFSPHTNFEKL